MKNPKSLLRRKAFNFLIAHYNVGDKFDNICGKTGHYNVPLELFQKRCRRNNRALISWRSVVENNLSFDQLNSFEGGVVIDFVNHDFFTTETRQHQLFPILEKRLGSEENVSAIISIRSEQGNSSSAIPREAFEILTNNTTLNYKNETITITKDNYLSYSIKQDINGKGYGNETWSGFLFISIRGGQQDKTETHPGQNLTLFNPACEYASADVREDINLIMAYYAFISIDESQLKHENQTLWEEYKIIFSELENMLKTINYDYPGYTGNLLEFAQNHYSVSLIPGQLTDPIQLKKIDITNFDIKKRSEDSLDVTHEEAVIHEKYYWDNEKKCILTPARPTNLFWSFHLSNMMQQNYGLEDYFSFEEERFTNRQLLIEKSRRT